MRFLAVLALVACSKPAPPPALGRVPEFAMVDQTGKAFSSAELHGKPWVADFIYTRCTEICPTLTETFAGLQTGARKVSFSVDAEDTPEMLTAFARAHHADWTFLKGDAAPIAAAMKLALDRQPGKPIGQSILHGSHFVLVDAEMQVRGYYNSTDPEALARLLKDVASLRP
jgi:protein SCO1